MGRVTVKDISIKSNLSLGTVSKALSGKRGVNPNTRRLVLDTAKELGYKVNRIAQSLSRNPFLIGILMPSVWPEYYGFLELGIRNGLHQLQDYNIRSRFKYVPTLFSRNEIERAVKSFFEEKIDAVIMCPALDPIYSALINRLYENKIPVLVLGNDVSDCERLSCVRTDSLVAGKLAGEFMRYLLPDGGSSVILIGNKNLPDHTERINGYSSVFTGEHYKIHGVYETHDEPEVANILIRKLMSENADINGVYVATGNSVPVCEYIDDRGIGGKIKIIATDIFPKTRSYLERDVIQAIIFQDQIAQGEYAIKSVFDYLAQGVEPEPTVFMQPQLILKSNLEKTCSAYFEEYKREMD